MKIIQWPCRFDVLGVITSKRAAVLIMDATRKLPEKAKRWYESYVAGALEPGQAKFWFLFWGSVVASCAIFYVYTFYISDELSHPKPAYLTTVVTDGCVLLPALVLRRLHFWGLVFILYFLAKWLGILSLVFWLLILVWVTYHNRNNTTAKY